MVKIYFMDNSFLTLEEAANYLRVTRQTVSKYIKEEKLNAVKVNKSYRIPVIAFESFVRYNSNMELPFEFTKNSRNCTLEYNQKTSEIEILTSSPKGKIVLTNKQHTNKFNSFYFGDNLEILNHLLPTLQGKVDLIYIDPPFGTGQSFAGLNNDEAYNDTVLNHSFLDFIRKRLILLREFLSREGSIYLHIDKKIGHYVKIIMDEIFGYKNFINDITRIKCNPKNFARNAYGNYSDMVLFYAKEKGQNIFNNITEPLSEDEGKKLFPKINDSHGRYTTHPLHAPGETLNGDTGKEWNGLQPPAGRHWRKSREELTKLQNAGLIEWSEKGNPRKMVFLKDHIGKKVQDVWLFKDKGLSYVKYPTQKNYNFLERILINSSNPDSLILDCFAGSGSTLLTANKLKRNWIGIDQSTMSYATIKKDFYKESILCNYYELKEEK